MYSPLKANTSPGHQACPATFSSSMPPRKPPLWLWTCHKCKHSYPLGATRRCLHDGHLFCSGMEISKRTGRMKRVSPCGSVFDYVGWRAWVEWRDQARLRQLVHPPKTRNTVEKEQEEEYINKGKRNCHQNCNFPSECHWSPKVGQQMNRRETSLNEDSDDSDSHLLPLLSSPSL